MTPLNTITLSSPPEYGRISVTDGQRLTNTAHDILHIGYEWTCYLWATEGHVTHRLHLGYIYYHTHLITEGQTDRLTRCLTKRAARRAA